MIAAPAADVMMAIVCGYLGSGFFVRRVKQTLPGELFLQLLERDIQIARAVCRQRTAIELVRAVARKTVTRPYAITCIPFSGRKRRRWALERNMTHLSAPLRILERKVMVAGGIDFIIADLAAHAEVCQQLVAVEQKFDILVDLRNSDDILFHHTPSCRAVRTAIPMALSVEYCGSAKTGANSRIRSRSMELDATPPENTTGRPGYCASAVRVASAMQDTMQFMTNRAVSAALCVSE